MRVAIPISPTTVALAAAALILIPTATVHADATQARWQELFNQLDQDRDGLLSRAEYDHAVSLQGSAKPQAQAGKSAQPATQSSASKQAASGLQQAIGSQAGQPGSLQQGQVSAALQQMPYLLVLIPNPSYQNQEPNAGQQDPSESAQSPTGQNQPSSSKYAGGNMRQNFHVSFGSLDTDRNGYLDVFEAMRHLPLLQGWGTADANRDGMIEHAEFSAFETRGER